MGSVPHEYYGIALALGFFVGAAFVAGGGYTSPVAVGVYVGLATGVFFVIGVRTSWRRANEHLRHIRTPIIMHVSQLKTDTGDPIDTAVELVEHHPDTAGNIIMALFDTLSHDESLSERLYKRLGVRSWDKGDTRARSIPRGIF